MTNFCAWESSSWERRRCASGVVVMYCANFSTCNDGVQSLDIRTRGVAIRRTFASLQRKYARTRYFTRSISVCTMINLKCSSSDVLGSDLSSSSIVACCPSLCRHSSTRSPCHVMRSGVPRSRTHALMSRVTSLMDSSSDSSPSGRSPPPVSILSSRGTSPVPPNKAAVSRSANLRDFPRGSGSMSNIVIPVTSLDSLSLLKKDVSPPRGEEGNVEDEA